MGRRSLLIPDEWTPILRQAALDAGLQSVDELLRLLIWESPRMTAAWKKAGLPFPPPAHKPWGGARRGKKKALVATEDIVLWGRNDGDDEDNSA